MRFTDAEMDNLQQVFVAANRTEADLEWALSRYPGTRNRASIKWDNNSMSERLQNCLDTISKDADYLAPSFMLRLIEACWTSDVVRRNITIAVPQLMRPPPELQTQIATVGAALDELVSSLPYPPDPNAANFHPICEVRAEIEAAAAALTQFQAVKDLHDALHILQVMGAAQLDTIAGRIDQAAAIPLQGLLMRVVTVATGTQPNVPPDCLDACIRCIDICTDALQRISLPDADEAAFAHASLRAMLVRELPLIDAALFGVSRDFPLRQFHVIFGLTPAHEAAIDLGDSLRRRLMEHTLWQATDLRLYAIEQVLAQPTPTMLTQLVKGNAAPLFLTVFDLRKLFDPTTAVRVVAPLNDVLLRYIAATGPLPPTDPALCASLSDLQATFANMRDAARSAFLDADRALKQDLAELLALRSRLDAILARVPDQCMMMYLKRGPN